MTGRLRRWTTNIAILVLVVLAMIGVGEIVARQALAHLIRRTGCK
jgi:hypothetical protein